MSAQQASAWLSRRWSREQPAQEAAALPRPPRHWGARRETTRWALRLETQAGEEGQAFPGGAGQATEERGLWSEVRSAPAVCDRLAAGRLDPRGPEALAEATVEVWPGL